VAGQHAAVVQDQGEMQARALLALGLPALIMTGRVCGEGVTVLCTNSKCDCRQLRAPAHAGEGGMLQVDNVTSPGCLSLGVAAVERLMSECKVFNTRKIGWASLSFIMRLLVCKAGSCL
jgi:hypothetical protein